MRKAAATAAVLVAAISLLAPVANAKSTYRWSSDERWAFIDKWSDWADGRGYRWPTLYADCIQKVAQKMYPTYGALMRTDGHKWIYSPGVTHCLLVYGDTYYDSGY